MTLCRGIRHDVMGVGPKLGGRAVQAGDDNRAGTGWCWKLQTVSCPWWSVKDRKDWELCKMGFNYSKVNKWQISNRDIHMQHEIAASKDRKRG